MTTQHPILILDEFCSWVDEELTENINPSFELGSTVADCYRRKANNTNKLRASNAGKPLVWHYLNAMGCLKPEALSVSTFRKFLRGHIEELETLALLDEFLCLKGYTDTLVTDTQTVTTSLGIEGHCDFVIRNHSGSTVVDIKTASSFSFDRWARRDYNDDYGYITQLALYQEHLGTDTAALLISNKERQNYQVRVIPEESLGERLERLRFVSGRLDYLLSTYGSDVEAGLVDIFESGQVPGMVESMYRNKGTGKYKPHPTIAYDSVKYLVYDIYVDGIGKQAKEYAAGVVSAERAIQRYRDWMRSGGEPIYAG